MIAKPPEELLALAKSLFEANEDIPLALIGGLAAQEIYATRRIRNTSDIDVAIKRDYVNVFLERLKKVGYETFYNETLDKYSAFRHEEGIHIDIYPDRVGRYSFDQNFWKKCREIDGLIVASPEDLIAIKLYSYLLLERGKKKHLIDIYSIIIGRDELNLNYLEERVKRAAKILDIAPKELLKYLNTESEDAKKALQQFSKKEIRFLEEEIKRIYKYLEEKREE